MVPHLITALNGPINELEARVLESMPAIERWFRLEWMEHTPPFYTSVHVRNAGFKLAPVDTDLFPGGWSHLTEDMLPLAVQAAMAAIEKICPEAKNLLVLPEPRQSLAYLASVARLCRVFTMAGLNVRLGNLDPAVADAIEHELPDGEKLVVEPLLRTQRRLGLKHFDPCTILLNTALPSGVPGVLEDLHEQYLLPPLHASSSMRSLRAHSEAYEEVAKKFAKLLGMDPWLIHPQYGSCRWTADSPADGVAALREAADGLLAKVRRKYKEYGINEKPFVVIKSDRRRRTGGWCIRDARDIELPMVQALIDSWGVRADPEEEGSVAALLQEGVPAHERINDAKAEPVVYMMDRYVVGGYYRVQASAQDDVDRGLAHAAYVPLAFADSHHLPKAGTKPGASAPNRFYMYGVVGRLAMLAASYELEATDPDAETYD